MQAENTNIVCRKKNYAVVISESTTLVTTEKNPCPANIIFSRSDFYIIHTGGLKKCHLDLNSSHALA